MTVKEFLVTAAACVAIAFATVGLMSPYAPVRAASVGPTRTPRNITLASTSVGTSWTTIGATNATVVQLSGRYPSIWVEVANSNDGNSADLSDFRIQTQAYSGGSWEPMYSGTDWSDGVALNADSHSGIDANGAYVNTLGSSEDLQICLSLAGPVYAIRFQAKVAANTANVAVRGMAK